jgi:hypothetical protein
MPPVAAEAPSTTTSLNVPPDILYTLGNGPVGGVLSPTPINVVASPDRVVVRTPDQTVLLNVLQLTMLLQPGSAGGGDVPQFPDGEQPPTSRSRTEEEPTPSVSVTEWLREVEQVVDLFFEACGRLPALSEQDPAFVHGPDNNVMADTARVQLTLPNPVSSDFEHSPGEDEGTSRPAAWRWLPVLLLGGTGAAALVLAIHQRKRIGAWPPRTLP